MQLRRPNPVCSVYSNTAVLFVGHVVRIDHVYDNPPEEKVYNGKTVTIVGPGQNLAHFEITKIYRGSPDKEVVVHTPDQGLLAASVLRRDMSIWCTATWAEWGTEHEPLQSNSRGNQCRGRSGHPMD